MIGLQRVVGIAILLLAPCDVGWAERGLDPAFATWIGKNREASYREIAVRFLSSAGRETAEYSQRMDAMESEFRAFIESKGSPSEPRERALVLQEFFFSKQHFQADLDLGRLENLFPDAILDRRKGYCLGLTLVLLDLGERVGWPLQAASAPRHTFVRYGSSGKSKKSPGPINIETTRGGELHDDAWYERHFGYSAKPQVLTPVETAAHLLNNHGFVLLRLGDAKEAEKEFRAALTLAPELVEAWINLGVLEARRGDFSKALETFDRAHALWPKDSDVRMNRVQALVSLDRHLEAAKAFAPLTPDFPDVPRLRRALLGVREGLDREREWDRIQEITLAVNRRSRAEAGKSPGLRAIYYRDRRLRERGFERIDSNVEFQWKWGSPGRAIPKDNFSVRWTGWLDIPEDDVYEFWIILSDGVRVTIDGHRVIDSWRRANDNSADVKVPLKSGLHDLEIEYFESVGEAGIKIFFTADKKNDVLDLSKFLAHPTTNN